MRVDGDLNAKLRCVGAVSCPWQMGRTRRTVLRSYVVVMMPPLRAAPYAGLFLIAWPLCGECRRAGADMPKRKAPPVENLPGFRWV